MNAPSPMLVTLLGIVTLVRLEQFSNTANPMLVTLSGIVTLVRAGCSNASSPMVVTVRPLILVGMVTTQGGPA